MSEKKIPNHVGIIMDGNGRWAQARGKKRSYGHHAGSANVDRIVSHAFACGIKTLTLYAFSSENWARPKEEVDELMKLLKTYFKKFIKKVIKNDVKLVVIGGKEELSDELKRKVTVEELMQETGMSRNKIMEAIRFSGNNIEYIEVEEA